MAESGGERVVEGGSQGGGGGVGGEECRLGFPSEGCWRRLL